MPQTLCSKMNSMTRELNGLTMLDIKRFNLKQKESLICLKEMVNRIDTIIEE